MKDDYDLSELQQITVRGLKYHVMPRYLYHYTDKDYEKFSLDLLDRLVEKDSVAIDIGGHYGIYSLLAAEKAKMVYAFEPVPENYTILTKNVKANGLHKKITAINKATSDAVGTVTFNIPWASDSAGFYEHPNAETIRKIQVQTTSVDAELKGVTNVSFIKIDTEGHELHVLDGLRQTLKANKTAKMLIEFNPDCLHRAGATPEALVQKIISLGYDIFALYEDERHMLSVTADMTTEQILQGRSYLNFLCVPKGVAQKLFFVAHNAGMGGAELILLRAIKALLQHTNAFVVPYVVMPGDGPFAQAITELPVASRIVPMRGWTDLAVTDALMVQMLNGAATTQLARLVSEFKPDAVVTNTISVPWGAFVAKAYDIPHVWLVHEFGDLDHRLQFNYGYSTSLTYVDQLSDLVVVISKAVEAHVGRYISTRKMKLLYPDVDVPKQVKPAKNAPFSKSASLKLALSGRISPTKGQFDAVQALKLLLDRGVAAELMLIGAVGSQDYYDQMVAYAQKHHFANKLHFVDFTPDPYPYVQAADIALVTSTNEAFGMVTVEAMKLGKPLVATASGGTAELVVDGKSGLLYEPGKPEQLADKIMALNTPAARQKLGESAAAYAYKQFPLGYADTLQQWIAQTIAAAKPHPEFAVFGDLLSGMYEQTAGKDAEIAELVRRHNEELQAFSNEYNKVYAAYEKVDRQLSLVRRAGIMKLYRGAKRVAAPIIRRKNK